MAFSIETVKRAFIRANGHCECRRMTCNHGIVRCNKPLNWQQRGNDNAYGGGKRIIGRQSHLAVMTVCPIAKFYVLTVIRTPIHMGATVKQKRLL